jgi:hypothetical protein
VGQTHLSCPREALGTQELWTSDDAQGISGRSHAPVPSICNVGVLPAPRQRPHQACLTSLADLRQGVNSVSHG